MNRPHTEETLELKVMSWFTLAYLVIKVYPFPLSLLRTLVSEL